MKLEIEIFASIIDFNTQNCTFGFTVTKNYFE